MRLDKFICESSDLTRSLACTAIRASKSKWQTTKIQQLEDR